MTFELAVFIAIAALVVGAKGLDVLWLGASDKMLERHQRWDFRIGLVVLGLVLLLGVIYWVRADS